MRKYKIPIEIYHYVVGLNVLFFFSLKVSNWDFSTLPECLSMTQSKLECCFLSFEASEQIFFAPCDKPRQQWRLGTESFGHINFLLFFFICLRELKMGFAIPANSPLRSSPREIIDKQAVPLLYSLPRSNKHFLSSCRNKRGLKIRSEN